MRLGPEDIHKGRDVIAIDMLGEKRNVRAIHRRRQPLVHGAQAGNGGEKPQGAARRCQEQGAIGGCQAVGVAAIDIGDHENPGLRRIVEGRGDRHPVRHAA